MGILAPGVCSYAMGHPATVAAHIHITYPLVRAMLMAIAPTANRCKSCRNVMTGSRFLFLP